MNLISDHFDRAMARLAEEFRGIPEIAVLIKAKARQTQDLEDAIFGLFSALGVDNANTYLLGLYAKLVGLGPATRTNISLVNNIKALIKLNKASGTIPEILPILALILPTGAMQTLREGKAAFADRVSGVAVDAATAYDAVRILGRAKLGGVLAYFEWSPTTDADTFALDDATSTGSTPGKGLGDFTDLTVGGELAGSAVATTS
jgi:hypothetical protein